MQVQQEPDVKGGDPMNESGALHVQYVAVGLSGDHEMDTGAMER